MSSFPVNMKEVPFPEALVLDAKSLGRGATLGGGYQSTGGPRVGSFNKQVWGELRERRHLAESAVTVTPSRALPRA
jgi:hypothetical protein